MEQISYYTTIVSTVIVISSWFIFAGTFLLRKKPAASETAPAKTRDEKSLIGIALQGVGFALIWILKRAPFLSPFVENQYSLNVILQLSAVLLVFASIWTVNSAIRELGKQWSFQARLIEHHKLVTGGVYKIVRHPIYAAMLAMLIATGITISHWLVVIIAVAVFITGTKIRTVSEEKLLRGAFPREYEEYAERVPGFVPFTKL